MTIQQAITHAELVAKLKAMLTERGVHVPRHNDLKRLAGRCRTHQLIDRATFEQILQSDRGAR